MGLGASIGYCTKLTQNNADNIDNTDALYAQGSFAGGIHVALMGDPTLTMHNFSPLESLGHKILLTPESSKVKLTWPGAAAAEGYAVYRWDRNKQRFTKLNDDRITDTSYIDASIKYETQVYMVRAVKLQTSPSGSYYKLSQGRFDTASNLTPSSVQPATQANRQMTVFPNPTAGKVQIRPASGNALKGQHIQVTNINGKVIRHVRLAGGQSDLKLDLGDVTPGIYVVKWQGAESLKTRRLVIHD